MHMRIVSILGQDNIPQMVYDFVVDGIICAIERWLLDKQCVPVDEFMSNLKTLLQVLFLALQQRITDDPKWLE